MAEELQILESEPLELKAQAASPWNVFEPRIASSMPSLDKCWDESTICPVKQMREGTEHEEVFWFGCGHHLRH